MTSNHSKFLLVFIALAASVGASCGTEETRASHDSSAEATLIAPAEPSEARLRQRSEARWHEVARANWIGAYDFIPADRKQTTPLGLFLKGKENHQYRDPVVRDVVGIDDHYGYLRTTAVWTPRHPQVAAVRLEPGQTLTQEITLIEIWRWADGDWMYLRAQQPDEFFREHPELVR